MTSAEDYTEKDFKTYFAEIPHGAGTSVGADGEPYVRLDYSLQLAVGIRNFHAAQPAEVVAARTTPVRLGAEIARDASEAVRWQPAAGTAPTPGSTGGGSTATLVYWVVGVVVAVIFVILLLGVLRRQGGA